MGGVGIGNGWMNALVQGPAVIDYSWWHGLIDEPTKIALHRVFRACMAKRNYGLGYDDDDDGIAIDIKLPPPFHPFNVQDDCGLMWGVLEAAGNPNAYDVTTWDPNVDQVTFTSEAFYNREDVRKALHAPTNITWHGCSAGNGRRRRLHRTGRRGLLQQGDRDVLPIFRNRDDHRRRLYLDNDEPVNVVPYVADLLDADIPVLVYNGDRDMTTGGTGSELLLNGMDWKGKDGWLDATRGVWMAEDKKGGEGGWAKEHLALTFVIVYNSGHMVPYNQPVAAMDLLRRFLTNETFLDLPSPTIRFGALSAESDKADWSIAEADWSVGSSGGKGEGKGGTGGTNSTTIGASGMSFIAGMVVALFLTKLLGNKKRGNYSRIPDRT